MEIQQHNGVVVDVVGLRQGFAELLRERERGVAGEEGGAQGCRLRPSLPPLYRPLGGAPALGDGISKGGAAAKGGRGCLAPQGKGELPPRVSNPRRRGAQGGCTSPLGDGSPPTSAHGALRDRWPHPVDP